LALYSPAARNVTEKGKDTHPVSVRNCCICSSLSVSGMVVSLKLPGNITVNSGASGQCCPLDLTASFFRYNCRGYTIFGIMGKFFLEIV